MVQKRMKQTYAVRFVGALAIGVTALAGAPAAQAERPTSPVQPLERAHAHNDYEHTRPLADALDHGFGSVEADVWLVDGKLLVAHDLADVRPGRTLQSLYLDPLRDRVRANGGAVYRGWPGSLQLLVDVKSDGPTTYAALDRVLRGYPDLVTRWTDGREHARPVTAVVSGNRDLTAMRAQRTRVAAYDGRLEDLDRTDPASLVPLVSTSWETTFTWRGVGPMPAAERDRLRSIVQRAHAQGRRVRFWATPDAAGPARDAVWSEELAAGVDELNTDDLAGLQAWLLQHDPQEQAA